MISHDFTQIAEGFRTNDESDLIGSKLLNSPRNRGEIPLMKLSSSIENSRFFPGYPGQPIERPNPQGMTVVTFASEIKAQSSKSVIKSNGNSGRNNATEDDGKEEGRAVVVTKEDASARATEVGREKQNGKENGKDTSPEDGKENDKEHGKENGKESDKENCVANGQAREIEKESEKEVPTESGGIRNKEDGNGKETNEWTKENGKDGRENEKALNTEIVTDDTTGSTTVPMEANCDNSQSDLPLKPNHVHKESGHSEDVLKSLNSSTARKEQAREEVAGEKEKNGDQQSTEGDPTPKKHPVSVLSAKALTPREFVPREREFAPESSEQQTAKRVEAVQAIQAPTQAAHITPAIPPTQPLPVIPKMVPPMTNVYATQPKLKTESGSKLIRAPTSQMLAALQQQPPEPFTFSKDLAFKSKPIISSPSALAIQLTERSHQVKNVKASKLQIPDYHVPCLQLIVFVLIHSSFLPNKLNNIRVPPNATVEQVIEVAVKKLNDIIEKHRPEDPPLVPAKCQLVLAEEDGRPDTDTPVLQRDAAVHRFGCVYFALCKDPESEGGITADSKTFKVVLPSKEYQVLSYKRSLSLGQVLEKVCSKRQLDPSVHYFVYSGGNKDGEINLDTLVSDLETTEVTMKCRISRKHTVKNPLRPPLRSRSKNDVFSSSSEGQDSLTPPVLNPKLSRHLGVPKEFFWSPASVATYVQYTVIKINKYGKKQERIMGIDRERITNSMPLNKPNKTSRPTRLMTDVVRAFISDRPVPTSPSNRKAFTIEFKDNDVQEYESEKADEIVARINYIQSLENPTKSKSRSVE